MFLLLLLFLLLFASIKVDTLSLLLLLLLLLFDLDYNFAPFSSLSSFPCKTQVLPNLPVVQLLCTQNICVWFQAKHKHFDKFPPNINKLMSYHKTEINPGIAVLFAASISLKK